MKPIIGISGRCQIVNNKSYMGLYDELRIAIIKLGGIPILILPTETIEYAKINTTVDMNFTTENDLIKELDLCDGIIIPGGDKEFYYDKVIIDYCIKKDKPILGICLGMQMMGLYDKGNLAKIKGHNSNELYVHNVKIKKDTLLNEILGNEVKVNSRHKECITNTNKYKISAISEDAIIEGIEYPFNTFNIGVQWHPELMINYNEKAYKLLKEFINASKLRKEE